MISPETLEKLHRAAKIIEADGTEGIKSASAVVGEEVAMALLVLFLRVKQGSLETWPTLSGLTELVDDDLRKAKLIT